VSVAAEFVATAELKIEEARVKVAEANALLAASIDELTEEDRTKLRTLAQETQGLLREAHLALRDSIKALREAVKAKIDASASATTSTEVGADE